MRSASLLAALVLCMGSGLAAQTRTVALTIDDLPFVMPGNPLAGESKADQAMAANRKLLEGLARHKTPVTGFVVQKGVEDFGPDTGTNILREWLAQGLDLGNHSYSHPEFNNLTVEQFEDEIVRGEIAISSLLKAAGRKPEFFRFPYNQTGDTKEKHDAVARFLEQHGYRLAPCTINNSDWVFNAAYVLMLARHDRRSAARLKAEYLAFTGAQIDYFSGVNKQVLGYEPPEIMLIHDNQLNADVIGKLLALFEKRKYKWVTLNQAESDPVYRSPDNYITPYGMMWGYRWARERGVTVDGRLEPEPPKWIAEYGKP